MRPFLGARRLAFRKNQGSHGQPDQPSSIRTIRSGGARLLGSDVTAAGPGFALRTVKFLRGLLEDVRKETGERSSAGAEPGWRGLFVAAGRPENFSQTA